MFNILLNPAQGRPDANIDDFNTILTRVWRRAAQCATLMQGNERIAWLTDTLLLYWTSGVKLPVRYPIFT